MHIHPAFLLKRRISTLAAFALLFCFCFSISASAEEAPAEPESTEVPTISFVVEAAAPAEEGSSASSESAAIQIDSAEEESPAASESTSVPAASFGDEVASYALQYLGSPYCWGAEDPYSGFDCSGLVYYVYQHFGIELSRTAQGQAGSGESVAAWDLQPGDILCFYSADGSIDHSGIYIGSGMFIHSDSNSGGVVLASVYGYYESRGMEARRIILN